MAWLPFLAPVMLFGLFAMAIPIIIHLLNRRRFNVVDWGAMQFLQISEATRRRIMVEELLLMLLRMGLIAFLVMALALPFYPFESFSDVLGSNDRDVVLIFDGSYSMGAKDQGKSAHDAAKEWATAFVNNLDSRDTVAILQAKQQVVPVLAVPTSDMELARDAIADLPAPAGGCDWPAAIEAANKILIEHGHAHRDIIVLSDNQRFGWADDQSLMRWEMLANNIREDSEEKRPHVWAVNIARDRPASPPNWSLTPVTATRAVSSVKQQITFRTGLDIRGQEYQRPHALRVEVDGKPVATDLKAPADAKLEKGLVPLAFRHHFDQPGTYLVSVIVEPDPPEKERTAGYVIKDYLPGDNRQDYVIEVLPALPVLLVDGDERTDSKERGTDYLRKALYPEGESALGEPADASKATTGVMTKVITLKDFDAAMLDLPVGQERNTRPRVLVLSNVPHLSDAQQEAVTTFLDGGGGVLVTLGERVESKHYNSDLFKNGKGWLPAHLEDFAGDEDHPEKAPGPLMTTLFHPAAQLLRDVPEYLFSEARFPRWWRVTTPGRNSGSVSFALLDNNDPLLVEKNFGNGRVVLASVPLDSSWRTNFTSLPAFVPLAKELVYYLGGVRASEHNLQPGQPIRYRPDTDEGLDTLSLQMPLGKAKPLTFANAAAKDAYPAQLQQLGHGSLVVIEGTRETGVYRLHRHKDDLGIPYVVQYDPRESDLTPVSQEDRDRLEDTINPPREKKLGMPKRINLTYQDDRKEILGTMNAETEHPQLWWLLLAGVVLLLCCEILMTRWLVKNR